MRLVPLRLSHPSVPHCLLYPLSSRDHVPFRWRIFSSSVFYPEGPSFLRLGSLVMSSKTPEEQEEAAAVRTAPLCRSVWSPCRLLHHNIRVLHALQGRPQNLMPAEKVIPLLRDLQSPQIIVRCVIINQVPGPSSCPHPPLPAVSSLLLCSLVWYLTNQRELPQTSSLPPPTTPTPPFPKSLGHLSLNKQEPRTSLSHIRSATQLHAREDAP